VLEKIRVRVRVKSRAREDLSCLPFLALLAARNRGASFAASFSGHENVADMLCFDIHRSKIVCFRSFVTISWSCVD
jgi:hypothetical protein